MTQLGRPTEHSEGGSKGGARGGVKPRRRQNPRTIDWSLNEGLGTVVSGIPIQPGDWIGIDRDGGLWVARRLTVVVVKTPGAS